MDTFSYSSLPKMKVETGRFFYFVIDCIGNCFETESFLTLSEEISAEWGAVQAFKRLLKPWLFIS